MKLKCVLILLIFIVFGCDDKESPEPENFISITTEDRSYLFTQDIGVFNVYIIGSNQDQLSMVLKSENNFLCEIHIQQSNLLQRDFPFSLPSAGDYAYGEIQIINLNIDVDSTFGADDDVNFVGISFEDLEITILSFDDGLLRGRVNGPVTTKTGREMSIENGEFKVHIEIEEGA